MEAISCLRGRVTGIHASNPPWSDIRVRSRLSNCDLRRHKPGMKIIKFYIDILLAAPITQIFLIGSDIDLFTGQEN